MPSSSGFEVGWVKNQFCKRHTPGNRAESNPPLLKKYRKCSVANQGTTTSTQSIHPTNICKLRLFLWKRHLLSVNQQIQSVHKGSYYKNHTKWTPNTTISSWWDTTESNRSSSINASSLHCQQTQQWLAFKCKHFRSRCKASVPLNACCPWLSRQRRDLLCRWMGNIPQAECTSLSLQTNRVVLSFIVHQHVRSASMMSAK